jgi:malonyl CoA-acyl carrier protein transacylase
MTELIFFINQVVIAGARDAVARASEIAKAMGAKRVVPLPVSAPFHCALMKPAEDRLERDLRALSVSDPRVPVVANVDAEPKRDGAQRSDSNYGSEPGFDTSDSTDFVEISSDDDLPF